MSSCLRPHGLYSPRNSLGQNTRVSSLSFLQGIFPTQESNPGLPYYGQTFFWGGSKITADGACSHEIKRHLLLGRKAITNLDSILKSTDITLSTKVCLVKATVFPAVMYGCESWTIKKAECQKFDAFKLWCWRRLLRVPWTARRSNQSMVKEISHEYALKDSC